VSLARVLNRPGRFGRAWRATYEVGYVALRSMVLLAFRPLFLVRREGPEPRWPTGGFLLCPNHTSFLDPGFVQMVVPRRVTFVMTNEFYVRAAGRWFFALVGAVPMAPGRMGHRGLRRAAALLRRGHVVVLFPEGRISVDGRPGHAHRGVGTLARLGRVPVIPVGIRGAAPTWPPEARWFRRSDVRVRFGEPLAWNGLGMDIPAPERRERERAFALTLMEHIRQLAGFPPNPPANVPPTPSSLAPPS
jgi:1-acyl-sn-glycerol-3-phosphate acyltransferase